MSQSNVARQIEQVDVCAAFSRLGIELPNNAVV
jgi:hypothetical protein